MNPKDPSSELSARFEYLEPRLMLSSTPVASALADSTYEDTPLSAFVSGTDGDNDWLTFALNTGPSNGEVSFSDWGLFVYTPDQDFTGQDTFTFTASDGQTTSTSATVTITINAVNDAPILAGIETTSLSYTENDSATAITSTITVSDVDDTNIESATIQITGNVLSFVDAGNITGSWVSGTGTLTLSGSDTKENYQAALRLVKYNNTSDDPNTGDRTVSFTVNDGDDSSATVTRDISITPVNDAPVLANIEGGALSYTENDSATSITSTITVSDGDDTNIESASIQITTGYVSTEDVLSYTDVSPITGSWNSSTGILTLTGSDALADYQTALRAVKYQNTSDNPDTTTRTVSFTVNDGDTNSQAATRDISISAVNDAPINTVPGAQSSYRNIDLEFSSAQNNQILISDADAGSNSVKVILTGANGTISLSGTTGLTFTVGDGDHDATMTFTGTISNINTALEGMVFSPATDYVGAAASVRIQIDDQGNSGPGGPLTDDDTVSITIVNKTLWVRGSSEVNEGQQFTLYMTASETVNSWEIDWNDGQNAEVINQAGTFYAVTHTYDDDYVIDRGIVVTADTGVWTAPTYSLAVNNVAPALILSGDDEVEQGETYTLGLSSYDPGDDDITEWTINWGDGSANTVLVAGTDYTLGQDPANQTHTYSPSPAGPTNYEIKVIVEDDDDLTGYADTVLPVAVTYFGWRFHRQRFAGHVHLRGYFKLDSMGHLILLYC